ncbi:hypothetical protein RF11_13366 [Thelohanellus kitauei]|uniref:Uncharacterized protein n=1 Tax=Thelohanellus kitauei TaxID=669202 RepID=A0A0C2IS26_THEKT|nr:hypothetical protein RF11_13366 [Thelohanellus kitauei]
MRVKTEFEDKFNASNKWSSYITYHLDYYSKNCGKSIEISHGKNPNISITFYISLYLGNHGFAMTIYTFKTQKQIQEHIHEVSDSYGLIKLFVHFKPESNEILPQTGAKSNVLFDVAQVDRIKFFCIYAMVLV